MALISQTGNASRIKEDKNKVCDYVKNNLFERVAFIWDEKALDDGKVLHKDFLERCKSIVLDEDDGAANSEAETYINFLWREMKSEKCYHEWMSQKRSNVYQSMQDKFQSK